MTARARTILAWALADLARDRVVSVMSVALLLLLLVPPLFLAVIRVSIIEGWAASLQADPRNREVIIVGEAPLTEEDLARIAGWPETGFLVPEPTTFVSSTRLVGPGGPASLDMQTSALGDPILGGISGPDDPDGVTLTHAAAKALGVATGDMVDLTLRRDPANGPREFLSVALTVTGVVPPDIWPGQIAFLSPLRAAGVTEWLAPGSGLSSAMPSGSASPWRSMRIYATEVRSAPALAARLDAEGFDTRIASEQVSRLVTLSDGLRDLMTLTVTAGLVGLAVAVWLLQMLAVARRQADIALMAVAGLGPLSLIGFFMSQAIVLVCGALALAAFALWPMTHFAADFANRFVVLQDAMIPGRLPVIGLVGAAALILLLALTAGGTATWRLRRMDLSKHLRAD